MDKEQASQLSFFAWIIALFLGYPALTGWGTWKLIQIFNLSKGLMVVGVCAGLFLATFQILVRVKKDDEKNK